jgi:hypothetical protein
MVPPVEEINGIFLQLFISAVGSSDPFPRFQWMTYTLWSSMMSACVIQDHRVLPVSQDMNVE